MPTASTASGLPSVSIGTVAGWKPKSTSAAWSRTLLWLMNDNQVFELTSVSHTPTALVGVALGLATRSS